jgi:hypothetical protein
MSETPPQLNQNPPSSPASFSQSQMIRFEAERNQPDSRLFFAGFLAILERIVFI